MSTTKRDPSEQSVLTGIYYTLRQQSACTKRPRGQDLRSGARLTVSVRGDTVTVIISRPAKPLGSVELITFQKHCEIPAHAERAPRESQEVKDIDGVRWHRVAFRWRWTDAE